jgi:hypothetical protein
VCRGGACAWLHRAARMHSKMADPEMLAPDPGMLPAYFENLPLN